jgi:hypothetical protein
MAVVRRSGMYDVLTPEDAAALLVDSGGAILNPLVGGLPPQLGEKYFASFIEQALPLAMQRVETNRLGHVHGAP